MKFPTPYYEFLRYYYYYCFRFNCTITGQTVDPIERTKVIQLVANNLIKEWEVAKYLLAACRFAIYIHRTRCH